MRTAPLLLGVAALLALTACDDEFHYNAEHGASDSYDDGYCGVQQVYEDSCWLCHSAASPTVGLDLESDPLGATVDVASAGGGVLVVPGDRDSSVLYLKSMNATPTGEGGVMPPGGSGLSDAALEVLGQWIDDGAVDDCSGGGGGGDDTATDDTGS